MLIVSLEGEGMAITKEKETKKLEQLIDRLIQLSNKIYKEFPKPSTIYLSEDFIAEIEKQEHKEE